MCAVLSSQHCCLAVFAVCEACWKLNRAQSGESTLRAGIVCVYECVLGISNLNAKYLIHLIPPLSPPPGHPQGPTAPTH